MRLAVAAGGPAPENNAYVRALLGELERRRGHDAAARRRSAGARARAAASRPRRRAWRALESAAPSARARRGDARGCARSSTRLPLPEYVVALGETELAAGRTAAARRDLALVGAEQQLQRAAGVDIDVELAVFEADHGSPAKAVDARPARLGTRRRACAPPTRSAGR